MSEVYVITHPLVQDILARLRDKNGSNRRFRELMKAVSGLVVAETLRDIPVRNVRVHTPLAIANGKRVSENITIVLIIRAGIGMLNGITNILPEVHIGYIGMYRNEETLEPVHYYHNIPDTVRNGWTILIDPMLATGGSAVAAVNLLKEKKSKHIRFLSLISAPEGIEVLKTKHPDVNIFTAAIDKKLNKVGYIIPGLGDAGDRLFG